MPNNACVLLFSRDPRRTFPRAYVQSLRYEGTEERSGQDYNVREDRVIETAITSVIRETAQLPEANIREFTGWPSGKFHTVPEYPYDAWYELLVMPVCTVRM